MRIQNRFLRLAAWSFAALACAAAQARATPFIVLDAASGRVVLEQESTHRWYPASLTKLMTLYVALSAVREKRVTLDTPIVVSMRAARMPASKMGFNPGS